jgi:hypothetical protein
MTQAKQTLRIGDRVAERNKNISIPSNKPESQQIITQHRSPRRGEIVKTDIQINRRGHKIVYHWVRWDGLKSPSLHAQNRLCLVEEAEKILNDYRESLN